MWRHRSEVRKNHERRHHPGSEDEHERDGERHEQHPPEAPPVGPDTRGHAVRRQRLDGRGAGLRRIRESREVPDEIVDHRGVAIAHSSPGLVRERVSLHNHPAILEGLRGTETTRLYTIDGREVLGTVSRLVGEFATLGDGADHSDTALIAGGIAEELNTTIAGLCVAVIMVIFHSYFTRRLERIAARLEVIAGHLLHEYHRHGGSALHTPLSVAGGEAVLPPLIPPRAPDDTPREAGKSDFLP